MNNEIWRPIPEYESLYSISNFGRVKRYYKNGSENILNNHTDKNGYMYVVLSKQNEQKKFYNHRLVAMCFIPNPDNRQEVDHIDLNKFNNNVLNLRWSSRSENNKNRKSFNKTGKKFIYISKEKYFMVVIRSNGINKTFKTLDEALQYRNAKIIEYNISFHNHYDS